MTVTADQHLYRDSSIHAVKISRAPMQITILAQVSRTDSIQAVSKEKVRGEVDECLFQPAAEAEGVVDLLEPGRQLVRALVYAVIQSVQVGEDDSPNGDIVGPRWELVAGPVLLEQKPWYSAEDCGDQLLPFSLVCFHSRSVLSP